jgi:hypothetical protein
MNPKQLDGAESFSGTQNLQSQHEPAHPSGKNQQTAPARPGVNGRLPRVLVSIGSGQHSPGNVSPDLDSIFIAVCRSETLGLKG